MTDAEFAAYLEVAIPEFARDKVLAGQWAEVDAIALSRAGYTEMLPTGLATPGNYLYTIRTEARGACIGMLWFAEQERGPERVAFLYDIVVLPAHQGQGHGTRALHELEAMARSRGLAGIGLHVFGHNPGAHALYRRLGYRDTNINMYKAVDRFQPTGYDVPPGGGPYLEAKVR
ncbi:MAG: GNAT family N-acetyltransferase [Gammaproteobacteria bacterium]